MGTNCSAKKSSVGEPASTRRINAAKKLLVDPTEAIRLLDGLADDELSDLGAMVRQQQSTRALARGDLDEIINVAFETGFGTDNLATLPWIESSVIVCPGGLIWTNRSSHNCRFVSVNDTWVWDCQELIREDKRSLAGKREGFKAVALLPILEGMELDAVFGKARSGQHSVDRAISYIVSEGALHEVSQRNINKSTMR